MSFLHVRRPMACRVMPSADAPFRDWHFPQRSPKGNRRALWRGCGAGVSKGPGAVFASLVLTTIDLVERLGPLDVTRPEWRSTPCS
jgi:hypothetical protein